MNRFTLPIILLLIIFLAGCRPTGQMLASLQYHNIKWRLAKTKMTMSTGDGSIDARKLMEAETYVGCITIGNVTAYYPQGLQQTASELAAEFNDFYPIIKSRLGIDWSFHLVLRLVRVNQPASGYYYSTTLPKNRQVIFPIPVTGTGPDNCWMPVVAHEVTEASLLAPQKRSQLVIGDIYSGQFCLPMGTRWFRDGTSDYAEYLFLTSQPGKYGCVAPGYIYSDLNKVRGNLLSWSNCEGAPDWYGASSGLMFEMTNRFGDDAISRMMCELSKTHVPDGGGLKRAFERTTGQNLCDFLRNYETPWTGFETSDTEPDLNTPCCVLQDNEVRVTSIFPATPASRRGIKKGDVIITFEGQPVTSSNGLTHAIAKCKPWSIVSLEIMRGTECLPMKLKLIPRPVDINRFLELSGLRPQVPERGSAPAPRWGI